jgi:hypothetical protein
MFLPPYSPFLNPIENKFSKWKQFVRYGSPNDEAELIELIRQGAGNISNDDCVAFYMNMFCFIIRSLNKVVIINE